jgi:hypothetical protein
MNVTSPILANIGKHLEILLTGLGLNQIKKVVLDCVINF